MKSKLLTFFAAISIFGCATIINDSHVHVAFSFSNGKNGSCNLSNKRLAVTANIPSNVMARCSDDGLRYDCTTESEREGFRFGKKRNKG